MEYIRSLTGSVDSVTSLLVYALIVLLFIFGFLKCTTPVLRNRAILKRAIRSIKSGDKKHSWQDDGFLGKGVLFSHWSEYLNNLFFADGVYHNASNVEDYINEDSVIHGPGSSGFAEAIPGLMVSLGFMGTLIGLAVGLSGFDMADENAIMTSIETLIPGMRYAFMTSIVGVIASISFTLITRFVNGSATRAITGFYGAMSRYAGVLSVDPLTQVAIYQQEQTALIQTMAKDLNGDFTNRMCQTMNRAITDAIRPLNDRLNRFVSINTQEQMRFLDAVVGRFVAHMDRALNGQFNSLADSLKRTAQTQDQLIQTLEGHVNGISRSAADMSRLEKSATEMLDKLDGYMRGLNVTQRSLEDAYTRLSGNFEKMDLVSRQQSEYLRALSTMQNAMGETMQYMQGMAQAVSRLSASLNQTADGMLNMTARVDNEIQHSADGLAAAHREALEGMDQEISRSFNQLAGFMQDQTARLNETADAIAYSVERLPESVNQVTETLVEQVSRLSATLNRAQRGMEDVVDRMYGR